ncbi:MAG TPA: DNA mismatch repair endonuclease MutL [Candidatus Binataceae bacterium]|nr:DNA mismatch repair endonuclease MutL [Candidatus Binataceae bacterium]
MAERLIHILPEQVASQIAAGEVVERPASAVKELVENSLDAGAGRIEIAIERGGCASFAVADDGCGMSREDAILALRRHATSKIRSAGDLTAIRTLGFRGEALAAIASVARMQLRTRRADAADAIELSAAGGEIDDTRECAAAPGTQIEVRDLFFNTPARLKFLKTAATEQGAIAEAIQRLALANYRVAMRLSADNRVMFDLPRAASPLERVRQMFGPKLAARMLAFEGARDSMRVRGLATMSQESFASARMIFTFVNGRVVRDKLLARAIAQAYQTLMPRGRFPAVVMMLELRHEEVDVNVHPMKTEVRFRNSGAVFEAVYRTLRERLANQSETAAPADVSPAAPPAKQVGGAVAVESASSDPPVVGVARGADFSRPSLAAVAARGEPRALRLVPDPVQSAATQRALGLGFDRAVQGATAADAHPEAAVPMYSRLRVLGQLFAGYIALESEEGLLLVDQHAAHERVTFERLRAELRDGGVRIQAALAPATLELNPARAAQIHGAIPALRAMGFDVEAFGAAALILKGTPAVFGPEGGVKLLTDMIDSIGEAPIRAGGESPFDNLLKQLACHGSVRVGRVLEPAEIHALLAELDRTEFKTNCPHGRPVHIRFARGQIERMFRR